MTRSEIIDKLTPIVREVFQNENMVLSEDLNAGNVETWTSLSFMQLLAQIEEQFGFRFRMMELIQLKTMGDIINVMEKHLD